MQKFILNLTNEDMALINEAGLECFMADSALGEKTLAAMAEETKRSGKIFLVSGEGACDLCQKLNLDGVMIDVSSGEHCAKAVNYARRQIGDKVLGVISRNRRHEAMLVSECEPDFVAFKAWKEGVEKTKELVSWYNEMFLIQSAVVLAESVDDIKAFDCDIVIGNAADYKNFCC